VDHHAAVDRGQARHVVAGAPDRDPELHRVGQVHGVYDVGETAAARDERRSLVDEAVVFEPRPIVRGIGGFQQLVPEGLGQLDDGIGSEYGRHRVSPFAKGSFRV
jgi:hypothetical protein